jgi:hypothetical protein
MKRFFLMNVFWEVGGSCPLNFGGSALGPTSPTLPACARCILWAQVSKEEIDGI